MKTRLLKEMTKDWWRNTTTKNGILDDEDHYTRNNRQNSSLVFFFLATIAFRILNWHYQTLFGQNQNPNIRTPTNETESWSKTTIINRNLYSSRKIMQNTDELSMLFNILIEEIRKTIDNILRIQQTFGTNETDCPPPKETGQRPFNPFKTVGKYWTTPSSP